MIETSPGAQVFWDDEFKGQANAAGRLLIPDPKPGEHSLRVTLAGKKDFVKSLKVMAGQESTVRASLSEREQPNAPGPSSVQRVGGPGANLASEGAAAPPQPQARGAQPLRVGGPAQAARILSQTKPSYPLLAMQARISGTVRLHALLAKDGTVQELELVSGPPLLVKAAMDAVRQWRYKPTLLNGDPVEVDTFVDVVFALESSPSR